MYYKCKICGCVCNLKYQMGFAKKHPVRYKCKCGVSIRGMYEETRGFSFENAEVVNEQMPDCVVYCAGEFFTVPPFVVKSFEETVTTVPSPFILATQLLNYEDYRLEFSHILSYRVEKLIYVRALNELYLAKNYEKIKEVIREKFDTNEELFPLNNEADYIRATTMINQFQFLNHDGIDRTPKTTKWILNAFTEHTTACHDFLKFVKKADILEAWKRQIYILCDQVYEKIDLLMPAVSIDFVKDIKAIDLGFFAITTTSFEEIKQLYVDLYELIGRLLALAIGLDNIILRDDYNAIRVVLGIDVKDLTNVMKMRNKGNIIKLIDDMAPLESLICRSLNSDIRNSIGHYSYVSNEIADSFGQMIEFTDSNNKNESETRSLLQICYDIWQMYKTLGIFNEIIHHLEMQLLAEDGIYPSYVTDRAIFNKLVHRKPSIKIYPNDSCPCGSGLKYKKCCGRNR